ncbi:MAG: hypothetical protein CLLPBCKN_001688 [Chroococcidiopsis cubana SAG 39.79]|jgi:hypothetical protein|nr:hypothetical protein [Chroococcidiopsis cubana SAG 39.79]
MSVNTAIAVPTISANLGGDFSPGLAELLLLDSIKNVQNLALGEFKELYTSIRANLCSIYFYSNCSAQKDCLLFNNLKTRN